MWAEMQGNKGETKVLEPLLEPLAGTPFCAGTRGWNSCWNPPFCAGIPAGTHLCALLVLFGNSK